MLDTSAIDNILNEFLEPFEATASISTDFEYLYAESHIHYALVISERMDQLFVANAMTLGLDQVCDSFILSFLHELGHHETLDEIEDADAAYSRNIKEHLTSSDEDCLIYFNLPDELAATQWAVDYINEHQEEVAALWNKLQPAILSFYDKYNIKGEE